MESSEYATDRGTTWRSTALALPENVQQVMHRATSTAEDVVLTKAGRRRLAEQQHWLPLGVCPDCQGGSLTAEHACDRCGLDWTKELKDMNTSHLREGQRVFTKADLLALHDAICHDAKDLMVLKNQDYSGATDDPFSNFRASSVVGVDPVAGIVLRCLDKFCRLRSFITSGQLLVKDEPVGDIFRDVVNYMILAAGMVEEARRLKKQDDCTVSLSEFP